MSLTVFNLHNFEYYFYLCSFNEDGGVLGAYMICPKLYKLVETKLRPISEYKAIEFASAMQLKLRRKEKLSPKQYT
jgi:hypothetical protein